MTRISQIEIKICVYLRYFSAHICGKWLYVANTEFIVPAPLTCITHVGSKTPPSFQNIALSNRIATSFQLMTFQKAAT